MNDVLREVLDAEAQAQAVVEAAKNRAVTLMAEARESAKILTTGSDEQARAEATRVIERACRDAEERKQQQLAAAAEDIARAHVMSEALRETVITAALRQLHGTGG